MYSLPTSNVLCQQSWDESGIRDGGIVSLQDVVSEHALLVMFDFEGG